MPHNLRTVMAQAKSLSTGYGRSLNESLASGTDTNGKMTSLALFWTANGCTVSTIKGIYDLISAIRHDLISAARQYEARQSEGCQEVKDLKTAWKVLVGKGKARGDN